MKHWPLSTILFNNPVTPLELVYDMHVFMQTGVPATHLVAALSHIADHTQSNHSDTLALVQSIGTPSRRLYLTYPDFEEWRDLERCCIMEIWGQKVFVIDALH